MKKKRRFGRIVSADVRLEEGKASEYMKQLDDCPWVKKAVICPRVSGSTQEQRGNVRSQISI